MMSGKLKVSKPVYPLLAVLCSVIVLAVGLLSSGKPPVFAAYFAGICLLYIIFGYGKILGVSFLMLIPIGLITGTISMLVKHDLSTGATTVGRFLLLGLSAIPLIATPPVNLTRCMTKLKMPRFLTLGMLIAIRFVPVLAGEVKRIREAMRTRGVNMAWYRIDSWYRAFIVPFMMQLINISDILAISVETRGFDLDKKEAGIYKPVNAGTRDKLFMAVFIVLSCAGVGGVILL